MILGEPKSEISMTQLQNHALDSSRWRQRCGAGKECWRFAIEHGSDLFVVPKRKYAQAYPSVMVMAENMGFLEGTRTLTLRVGKSLSKAFLSFVVRTSSFFFNQPHKHCRILNLLELSLPIETKRGRSEQGKEQKREIFCSLAKSIREAFA